MARVTTGEVQAILPTTMVVELLPFITAANLMTTRVVASKGLLSDEELKEVERWLAAHFAAIREPLFTQARSETDSVTFQRNKAGDGLRATEYGRQAIALDWSNALVQVGVSIRAFIRVD